MRNSEPLIKKIRETRWFLTDFDAHTNQIISTRISDENRISQALCQDGIKRDLWITDYKTITELKKSRGEFNLKFTVYKRDGDGGPIRKWDFPKKKLSRKEKEAKEWLDNLKKKQNKKG